MKSQVFHENKVLRSFDLALITVTMSFVTLYVLKSSGIFSGYPAHSETNEPLRVETPVLSGDPVAAIQESSAVKVDAVDGAEKSGSAGLAKPATSAFNFSTITGYLEPVKEDELKIEDWMVNPSVWFPAEKSATGMVTGAVTGPEVNSAEIVPVEPAIMTPAEIAGYLVVENEPAGVLEPWMTDGPAWRDGMNAGEATPMVTGSQKEGVFDTQGYLTRLISVNEALAEEKDPPLRLESWMVDDTYFNLPSSPPGDKKDKARRTDRKAAF